MLRKTKLLKSNTMGLTIAEKILSKASGTNVSAGDFILAKIDAAMIHDGNALLTLEAFSGMGGRKVWDPSKIVMVIDHVSPSASEEISAVHKKMREFSREQKIPNFYDIGEGICHQLMPEKGHVNVGSVVVGTDSHTCTYGAIGAFSTGIGSTDMAAVFISGKLWFKVPETLKFNYTGTLQEMVTPKDLILSTIGKIGSDGATYKAIEFTGSPIEKMSIDGRLTVCNMAVEMGAKAGIIAPDQKTINYLKGRVKKPIKLVKNDNTANYEKSVDFNVEKLEPMISCPNTVDNVKTVSEMEGKEIDQVFLGSCTDGRLEDMEIAVKILQGRKISPRTRMIVIPASREQYLSALKMGYIDTFLNAGCTLCNPGCGPCASAHEGILAAGEICLSTSNRNFTGRMGSTESLIYLSSPATAAASAIKGCITSPLSLP